MNEDAMRDAIEAAATAAVQSAFAVMVSAMSANKTEALERFGRAMKLIGEGRRAALDMVDREPWP